MKRYYGLCFFIILLSNLFVMHARIITVVIASQSSQKILAVKAAFKEKFQYDEINYISQKTFSLVPEQPVGINSAIKGARNRLNSLPENLLGADYVISIENYIERLIVDNCWYDIGLILFKHAGKEIIFTSKATFIPDVYVQLAQKMSLEISEYGYSVTVGVAIQRNFVDKFSRSIDPSDWHREVEFGGISRQQILKEAFDKVLY